MKFLIRGLFILMLSLPSISSVAYAGAEQANIRYGYEKIGELGIFYREAGNPSNPAIVLLHGFPASSFMYREVLRGLADRYYLIAPDYPSFGDSSSPSPDSFDYRFDTLAVIMNQFLQQRGLKRYSLMMQDYGAPIGFRIATAHPDRVQAIITQNGNAYEEGIGKAAWGPVLDYWKNKTPELERSIIENVFSYAAMQWQYTHGTRRPDSITPDNWNLNYAKISRPNQHRVQLNLLYDYEHNLKLYSEWQQYLRERKPPVLVVWGKNDELFIMLGAEAYKRDVKDIDYHLFNTGHFALEEDHIGIIKKIRQFLQHRNIK